MTVAYTMALFLTLLLGGCVGFAVGTARLKKETRKLEALMKSNAKELKAAEVDVEIVRALREGEIGIEDLQAVGFEKVRQEATGSALALSSPVPVVEDEQKRMPFVPLPYKRNVSRLEHLVSGDEVWIRLGEVFHDRDGCPCLWKATLCHPAPSRHVRTRVRYYEGEHELGIDPDDPGQTMGLVSNSGIFVDYVVTLRPEERWQE